MCKQIHISVSIARIWSLKEDTQWMNTHADTQERYVCQYTASTQPQFKKEMSCVSQRCKRSKERGRERGNAGRMACSPTLTIPKPFLAPPTCLCTVVTDGTLNELPLERWWGRRRGWKRDKQCLTQVAKKPLQLFHCTNSLFFQLPL